MGDAVKSDFPEKTLPISLAWAARMRTHPGGGRHEATSREHEGLSSASERVWAGVLVADTLAVSRAAAAGVRE